MTFYGMDPEQVRTQAGRVGDASRQLDELQQRLDAITRGVSWVGEDREAFLQQWSGGPSARMREATADLTARSQLLQEEADQQDRASGATDGPGLPATGAPGSAADLGELIGEVVDGVRDGIDWLGDRAREAGEAIGDAVEGARDWLKDRFQDAKDWTSDRIQDAKDWFADRKNDLDEWFQQTKERFDRLIAELDRPFAEVAAERLVNDMVEDGTLSHVTDVEVLGTRTIPDQEAPDSLADLLLDNDETRRTIDGTEPPRQYLPEEQAQIRVQKVVGADGVERYVVHVPPTQGAPLHDGLKNPIPGWDQQNQPFGWDNNLYAMAGKENAGANAVKAAMEEAGIPPGSQVAFVGHSQGGLVASQLADDPSFNGPGGYQVTDVFSVGSPVETFTPADSRTDVLNVSHERGGFRPGDVVPTLDMGGASARHPSGNPAPNVHDVSFGTPKPADGFGGGMMDVAHESVRRDGNGNIDPNSGYYGTVRNNGDDPMLAAKDERMRGKYYGDGTTVAEDIVVDVKRADR